MYLFYRILLMMVVLLFFIVAIEMDDQRLPIYLFLSDIVDYDDEVVVVVDRNRLTRGFQRITFFSPISLKLIVCVFIQWQFWAVKCCFSQSVQI